MLAWDSQRTLTPLERPKMQKGWGGERKLLFPHCVQNTAGLYKVDQEYTLAPTKSYIGPKKTWGLPFPDLWVSGIKNLIPWCSHSVKDYRRPHLQRKGKGTQETPTSRVWVSGCRPYPVRPHSHNSPASHPCTGPSVQGTGHPIPSGWSTRPRPRRSPTSETTGSCCPRANSMAQALSEGQRAV